MKYRYHANFIHIILSKSNSLKMFRFFVKKLFCMKTEFNLSKKIIYNQSSCFLILLTFCTSYTQNWSKRVRVSSASLKSEQTERSKNSLKVKFIISHHKFERKMEIKSNRSVVRTGAKHQSWKWSPMNLLKTAQIFITNKQNFTK